MIAAAKLRLDPLKAHAHAQWRRATQAVKALTSALSKARLDPDTVRTRTLTALTPCAGMELLRLIPELLAHQEPEMVRDQIAPIANAWCAQHRRSARAIPEGEGRNEILCAAVGESQLEAFAAMPRLNAINDAAVLYRLAAESWARIARRRLKRRKTRREALRRLARADRAAAPRRQRSQRSSERCAYASRSVRRLRSGSNAARASPVRTAERGRERAPRGQVG